MAEIINLNRARKNRAKAADLARAAQNRITYGRSKDEKRIAETERARALKDLDGKKLED